MKTSVVTDLPHTGSRVNGILRSKKTWIVILALVLVVAGGYTAYRVLSAQASVDTSETPEVQTAVARQGDLVVFASGAGSVAPATEIGIGFEESGTLNELLVKVGDKVQAGQVLARLQTDKTEEQVALAIADVELSLLTAQQALDDIYANSELDAAQALIDVEDAQQALEDLQDIDLRQAQAQQAIAEAEEALRDAQRVYTSVRLPADDNTIATARAELVLAEKKLKDQQEKFDDYTNKPDTDLEKASQQLKLSQVQSAYDSALRYYNAVTGTGSELDLESSAARLCWQKPSEIGIALRMAPRPGRPPWRRPIWPSRRQDMRP
jgi:multidrug efflux pump subunit AcrA (membrane-fusion protein)